MITHSHRSQGPLRGQQFRQANLAQMGIKIIDQKSESIYVDSEVSIKKRKQQNNTLEISRGLYKSRTYKEISKQDLLKEQDKFDSPLEQSMHQPLNLTEKFTASIHKLSVQGVTRIFAQKLLYYLKLQQQHTYLAQQFTNFLDDKASNTVEEESDEREPLNCKLFLKDSYERTILDCFLILFLMGYSLLIPFYCQNIEQIIIFGTYFCYSIVLLFTIFKIIDYKNFCYIDLPILVVNIFALFEPLFIFCNVIIVVKIYQHLETITVFTHKKLIRLMFSICIIAIHCNNAAQFWKQFDDDQDYDDLLSQQVGLLFNFSLSTFQEQIYYISLNRIISFVVLLHFCQQFFTYMKIGEDQSKKEEVFENILNKNTMTKQPLRIQHQVRQLLWSRVQSSKHSDSYASQIDMNFPDELRKSLNLHSYYDIIQKSSFIKQQFTTQFQQSLAEFAKELTLEKGEVIQSQQQTVNRLVFVREGDVLCKIENKRVPQLQKQPILNQYEFFACLCSPCNIVAKSRCKIIVIEFQQFYDLVCMHQQDFQAYRMWFDRMNLFRSRCSYKTCYICSNSHLTLLCPVVFYQPNYKKIVSNSTYATPNPRLKYQRLERKRVSSLLYQNLFSITAINWAQQFNFIAKNTDLVDQYLGNAEKNEEYQLFADDDHTSKYFTQTYTHQQSIKSPKTNKTGMTGRERDRVHTDSNINRTLTIRTLKASENGTNRLKPSINDSIVVSNSPSPLQSQPNKTPLMLFTKEQQVRRQSNISSSFTIDRQGDKKSSLQSQQQPVHSTSILQSKEMLQQLQSNLGSPNLLNTQTKVNGEFSINWHRSDTQPIFSDFIGSLGQLILIKDFENMQFYEWYFPKQNFQQVIESFRKYLSRKFNSR